MRASRGSMTYKKAVGMKKKKPVPTDPASSRGVSMTSIRKGINSGALKVQGKRKLYGIPSNGIGVGH